MEKYNKEWFEWKKFCFENMKKIRNLPKQKKSIIEKLKEQEIKHTKEWYKEKWEIEIERIKKERTAFPCPATIQ